MEQELFTDIASIDFLNFSVNFLPSSTDLITKLGLGLAASIPSAALYISSTSPSTSSISIQDLLPFLSSLSVNLYNVYP